MFKFMIIYLQMVVSINAAFFLNIHISSGSMEPTMATDSYSI